MFQFIMFTGKIAIKNISADLSTFVSGDKSWYRRENLNHYELSTSIVMIIDLIDALSFSPSNEFIRVLDFQD